MVLYLNLEVLRDTILKCHYMSVLKGDEMDTLKSVTEIDSGQCAELHSRRPQLMDFKLALALTGLMHRDQSLLHHSLVRERFKQSDVTTGGDCLDMDDLRKDLIVREPSLYQGKEDDHLRGSYLHGQWE